MGKYKYTNKEERPIPKYKNGDIAWYIDGLFEDQAKCYYDFGDIDQAAWVKSLKKADISDDTILILTDKEYRDDIIEKVNESLADDECSYDIASTSVYSHGI